MQKIIKYLLIFVIIRSISPCFPIIEGLVRLPDEEFYYKASHSDLKKTYNIRKNTDYYTTLWTLENEYVMESPKLSFNHSIPNALLASM